METGDGECVGPDYNGVVLGPELTVLGTSSMAQRLQINSHPMR